MLTHTNLTHILLPWLHLGTNVNLQSSPCLQNLRLKILFTFLVSPIRATHSTRLTFFVSMRLIYLLKITRTTRPGSVDGIATGYGLDGPGIKSRWEARFPAPVQTGLGAPPSLLYNGYRVFPGGKDRPGRDADPSPPSVVVGQERVELYFYSPMGCTACTEPQCLYKGALYLHV